jgi:hypothetical protein
MPDVKCFETSPPATRSVIHRHLVHVETQLEQGWCVVVARVRVAKISPAVAANLYLDQLQKPNGVHKHVASVWVFWFLRACRGWMREWNAAQQ